MAKPEWSHLYNGGIVTPITVCRLCKGKSLEPLFSLGDLAYSGTFPADATTEVPKAPLELVKCSDCQLVQLAHNPILAKMYGPGYGYRSGLNASMVAHLEAIAEHVWSFVDLSPDDIVMDIGSNDGTLLNYYPETCTRIGIDPIAEKFRKFYPKGVEIVPRFFHRDLLWRIHGTKARAKIVTSIAMFYDLPDPVEFASSVADILDDEGAWILEVAYLPEMMRQNAFDGICHEHLEYYCLKQIERIIMEAGLVIRDVSFNDTNGGSLQIVAMKSGERFPCRRIISGENVMGVEDAATFRGWKRQINKAVVDFRTYLVGEKEKGRRIVGLGASTKGNVLLQLAQIGPDLLPAIAEINPDKFGCFTPGTHIPIANEKDMRPVADSFVVLPWHFRDNIISREKDFLARGGRLIFPLPRLEVVTGDKLVKGQIFQYERGRKAEWVPHPEYEL